MAATRVNYVPLAPIRDHFLEMRSRGEITSFQLARNLGWMRKPSPATPTRLLRVPDGGRVNRTLGLRRYSKGRGYGPALREHVTYEMAARLVEAMGADPWELGL